MSIAEIFLFPVFFFEALFLTSPTLLFQSRLLHLLTMPITID
jgi:hypothetical protein